MRKVREYDENTNLMIAVLVIVALSLLVWVIIK